MIKRIFGVNIAVRNLEAAVTNYEKMFGVAARPMHAEEFAFPGLVGAQLAVGGIHLTLIASHAETSPVAKFLAGRGEGLFLLSVEVDAIDADAAEAKAKGFDVVLPSPASGAFGSVNFIHPKSMNGVQIELLQPARNHGADVEMAAGPSAPADAIDRTA